MAQKFVLTAQLQLQAPSNTGQVLSQIRKQLKGVNVDVKVKHNPKALKQANQQLKTISREGAKASKNVANLGKTMGQAARRFAAFSVATGVFLGIARAIKVGTTEAISFEKELLKISQVTGKSVRGLRDLTTEVTRLSRTFGAASAELLNASRTLSQAGFSADKATKALQILAQTDLGATFDSITDTTEGAIAMLRQFRKEAQLAGGDIAFLEKSLSAINSVSKAFAVESADLITVVRRTGGVFEAAGGKLNELVALFTSVRATTRESAETIAVGFRTIFTRIQRVETIDQLKELGIVLQDAKGQFIGPMKAIEQLSKALAGLDPRDYRFNQIVEQLGGFRQVGKVIPLIKQFAVAQEALAVAAGASGSVAADAQVALMGLGQQAKIVREDFASLMREFVGTDAFRSFAKSGLDLAKALMQIASALEPLIPMLTMLAAIKIGRGLAPALSGFTGMRKMARGGMVPGSGSRDTVPAMLTPGEFVIRKSSVNRMGSGQLKAMNENKFNKGKKITEDDIWGKKKKRTIGGIQIAQGQGTAKTGVRAGAAFLRPSGVEKVTQGKVPRAAFSDKAPPGEPKANSPRSRVKAETGRSDFNFRIFSGSMDKEYETAFEDQLADSLVKVSNDLAKNALGGLGATPSGGFENAIRTKFNFEQISGNIFEAAISASGPPFTGKSVSNDTFDFSKGLGSKASYFDIPSNIPTDAKRTFGIDSLASIGKKIKNKILEDVNAGNTVDITNFAGGGKVDSVPAMLTPGEFVVNKAASQRVGYNSLKRMNKGGVTGFNAGGAVGFANGGTVSQSSLQSEFAGLGGVDKSVAGVQQRMEKLKITLDRLKIPFEKQVAVLPKFGKALEGGADTAKSLKKVFSGLGVQIKKEKKQLGGKVGTVGPNDAQQREMATKASEKQIASFQRMSTVTNQMSMGLLFAGGAISTMATMFGSMSDAAKEQMNVGITTGTAIFALGNQVISMTMDIAAGIQTRIMASNSNRILAASALQASTALGAMSAKAMADPTRLAPKRAGEKGQLLARPKNEKGRWIADKDLAPEDRSFRGRQKAGLDKPHSRMERGRAGVSMMGAMMVAEGALIGVSIAAGINEAKLKAMAQGIDRVNKSADEFKKTLLEKGVGSKEEFVNMRLVAAMEGMRVAFNESSKGRAMAGGLGSAGAAGIGSLFAAGALGGGAAATGGTAVAGTVGALAAVPVLNIAIAAAAAAFVGFTVYQNIANKAMEKSSKFAKEQNEATRMRAEVEYDAVKAMHDFNTALKEVSLGTGGATEELYVLATETSKLYEKSAELQTKLDAATKKRMVLERELEDEGLIKKGGGVEAFDTNKALSKADQNRIASLKQDAEQERAVRAEIAKMVQAATQNEAKVRAKMIAVVADIFDTASEMGMAAPKIEFEGGEFKIATAGFTKHIEAMNAELKVTLDAIRAEGKEKIELAMKGRRTTEAFQLLRRQSLLLTQATLKNRIEVEQQFQTRRSLDIVMYEEIRARRAQKKSIEETSLAIKVFAAMAGEAAIQFGRMDAMIGVFTGSPTTATVSRGSELDNLANIDPEVLNNRLNTAFSGPIKATGDFQNRINAANRALNVVPDALRELVGRGLAKGVINADKLIDDLLGDAPEDLKKMLKSTIKKLEHEGGELSYEDVDKVKGIITDFVKKDIEVAKNLLRIQGEYVDQYAKATQAIIQLQNKRISAEAKFVEIQSRQASQMAQALGYQQSRQQRDHFRTRAAQVKLGGTGITAGNVASAGNAAMAAQANAARSGAAAQKAQQEGPEQIWFGVPAETDKEYTNRLNTLNRETLEYSNQLAQATAELERLANQSDKAADIMGEISKEQAKRGTMKGILEDFVGGSFQDRAQMQQQFGAMNMAVQQGSLQGMPSSMRKGVMGLLDKLGDIEIRGAGGMTGKEVKDELIRRDAARMGFDPKALAAIFDSTSKEDKLINDLRSLHQQELDAQKRLIELRQAREDSLIAERKSLQDTFFDKLNAHYDRVAELDRQRQEDLDRVRAVDPADDKDAKAGTDEELDATIQRLHEEHRQGAATVKELGKQAEETAKKLQHLKDHGFVEGESLFNDESIAAYNEAAMALGWATITTADIMEDWNKVTSGGGLTLSAFLKSLDDTWKRMEELRLRALRPSPNPRDDPDRFNLSPTHSTGGMIYKAGGGSIFKPRGTDTVPAMLTPGEFVIKKSSVDKIGAGNLAALNKGGGTVYRAGGGIVGGGVSYLQEGGPGAGGMNRYGAGIAGSGPLAAMYELWFGKHGFRGWAEESRAKKDRGNEIRRLNTRFNKELKNSDSRGLKPHQRIKDRSELGLGGMSDFDWQNLTYYKLFGPGGRQYYNGPSKPDGLSGYQMPGRDWSNLEPLVERGMAARKRRRALEGPPVYARREGQLDGETASEQGWREELEGAQSRLEDVYFWKFSPQRLSLPLTPGSLGSQISGKGGVPVDGQGNALLEVMTTFLEGVSENNFYNLAGVTSGSAIGNVGVDRAMGKIEARWGKEFINKYEAILAGSGTGSDLDQVFPGVMYRQYKSDAWTKQTSNDFLPSSLLKKKASQWLGYLSATKWSTGPEDAEIANRVDGKEWQKGRSDDGVPYSPESNLSTSGLMALNEMMAAVSFLPLSKQAAFYTGEQKARASSQVQEFNKGGQVRGYNMGGGVDTVPAMLTPGEFVMNSRSVNKYGSGFMNQLNQGNYLAEGGYPQRRPYTKAPAGVGSRRIDPYADAGYWVDPFMASRAAKRPKTVEEMRQAALANLMGPDPGRVDSTWDPIGSSGITYRQLAISQFRDHWKKTRDQDSQFKFLRLDKFGKAGPMGSPSDRPVESRRNDPSFRPRTAGDVWDPRAGSTTTDVKTDRPFDMGDHQTFPKANLPEGTPGWVRFEANMGNWQMEDAAMYQRIAEAWFPHDFSRQKDFTEALGLQWEAFARGRTPGIADLEHFLGISGFNDKPGGAGVRLQSDWFGKYASGQAKALMGRGFGSDINEFGFGIDDKSKWGSEEHKLARFSWWKKEWQQALSSWSAMEDVDIRTPDQVVTDLNAEMKHQDRRAAAGKDAQDFFGTLANHGTPYASGNLLYNFDVGKTLMTKLLGTSDNAGYSGDREATLERYVGFIQQMLDMQSGDTSMYGDLFKPQGRETGNAEMRLTQQKFAKGSGPLHKQMMEAVLQFERDKQALYTSKHQDTINSQMINLHKRQFAEFSLPYAQMAAPLPTAQDPSSSIAGGEFTPTEAAAAIAKDDDRVTVTDYRDPKEVKKKQREKGFRRASGGISRASAGVKLIGGRLYYQDAASVGNLTKGIRYGAAQLGDDSYLGKKGEMAQLIMPQNKLPSGYPPSSEMENLNKLWADKMARMRATSVARPSGLVAVEGEENWQFASHIISQLGAERAKGNMPEDSASEALAGERKKYLEKRLETATLWDSSGWRAPRGQRLPSTDGVVAKPLAWLMSGQTAGGVGPTGAAIPSDANPQTWFRFVSEDGKNWDSPGKDFSASDANILKALMGMGLNKLPDDPQADFGQTKGSDYGPQVQKFAAGGQVDSVPAMLTPGEFVMKNSAVNKYGAGFMHKLNQGKVGGFNQGGAVYLAAGGPIGVGLGGAPAPGAPRFPLGGKLDLLTSEQAEELIIKGINSMVSVGSDGKLTNSKSTRMLTNLMIDSGYERKNVRDFIKAKISKDPGDDPVMENVNIVRFVKDLAGIINQWAPLTLHSASGASVQVSDDPSVGGGGGAWGAAAAGAAAFGGPMAGAAMAMMSPLTAFQTALQSSLQLAEHEKHVKLLSKLTPAWMGNIMGLTGALQAGAGGSAQFAGAGRGTFKRQQKAMGGPGDVPPWFAAMFPQGFAAGGSVDSVPAMLTPGEFVMNKQAVKRHGTSFMSAINKGQVAGFAQGGPVSYLANGGSAGATSFLDDLSQIITSLSGIAGVFAGVFGGTMHHTISFDGSLKVKGMNFEFIAEGIKAELGNYIITEVATHFAAQKNNFNAT